MIIIITQNHGNVKNDDDPIISNKNSQKILMQQSISKLL